MTDTGIAKLPGLPALRTDDVALQRWAQAVAEHLEVRAGARGNPAERGVTQRDLLEATRGLDMLRSDKSTTAKAGDIILSLGEGLTVSVAIDAFAASIFDSPLYKGLMQRVDDLNRFDNVPEEVRKLLLVNIAEEAARRGADIIRVEKKIQTSIQSLAYTIEEVTAAVEGASAGVRETKYAFASNNLSAAGAVLQVVARLDNFAGGAPGVATIEQKFSTVASSVTGLSSEYTVKVSANGIFGGFGIAAYLPADPTKPGYSMFLVAADKFGIVFPGNVGGPDVKRIPFGIDANGIYMNSDVYIRGSMRVDAGGSRLVDGLRGSINIGISGGHWDPTQASNAIYAALGRGMVAPNNLHLVIGDTVTITSTLNGGGVTQYWYGSGWTVPGVVINGDMIIDGGLAARKINTNGLIIRDQSGTPIFGSGINLGVSFINGLGTLATKNQVKLGNDLTFPDGSLIAPNELVTKLSKINSGNIGTFIDGLAVTNAYIGNAAVETLTIKGDAVTVPRSASGVYSAEVTIISDMGATYHILGTWTQGTGRYGQTVQIIINGTMVTEDGPADGTLAAMSFGIFLPAGTHTFKLAAVNNVGSMKASILVLGAKR